MDLMAKGRFPATLHPPLADSTEWSGAFDGYERMVTSRISLEDTQAKGFEELVDNRDDQIKILISPKMK